jgi:heme/copper-type cytochrome/quinol oxidase subunit 4
MADFRIGWLVALLLAVLTIVEYVFASEMHDTGVRVAGVMAAGAVKAGFIAWFFMHLARVWRSEGAH